MASKQLSDIEKGSLQPQPWLVHARTDIRLLQLRFVSRKHQQTTAEASSEDFLYRSICLELLFFWPERPWLSFVKILTAIQMW